MHNIGYIGKKQVCQATEVHQVQSKAAKAKKQSHCGIIPLSDTLGKQIDRYSLGLIRLPLLQALMTKNNLSIEIVAYLRIIY